MKMAQDNTFNLSFTCNELICKMYDWFGYGAGPDAHASMTIAPVVRGAPRSDYDSSAIRLCSVTWIIGTSTLHCAISHAMSTQSKEVSCITHVQACI